MAEQPRRASLGENSEKSSNSGTETASISTAPSERGTPGYAADRMRLRSTDEARYNAALAKAEKDIQGWKGSTLQGSASIGQSIATHSRSIMVSDNSAAASAAYIEARNHLDRVLQGGESSVLSYKST